MIRFNRHVETNLKPYQKVLRQIRSLDYSSATAAEIDDLLTVLRLAAKESTTEQIMPEAFALLNEIVRQEFGWSVFDSQLLAAIAMNGGRVIELDTGEGKTLAAVFVACLRALCGERVHVLTFSDYLAGRDAAWMGPLYRRFGLRVAVIRQGMTTDERRTAYEADVTYMTAKEAGFDYLRGFLAADPKDLVQPPFGFAIIDEADSILIDEARIPLVIAGGQGGPGAIDPALYHLASKMVRNRHFEMDDEGEHVLLTESGAVWLESHLNIANLYDEENILLLAQVRLILQANVLLRRDVDYIVRDGEIQLVDEFTGRIIRDRQWPDGLHEAVELKEGLIGRSRGRILQRITLHDFLALYPGLCGMTGTASPAAVELKDFYQLPVTRIPPPVPCIRQDHPDVIFNTRAEKELALVNEIERRNRTGQPVLVGTASVEESETLAALVRQRGLSCEVLNARQDAAEAAVIAHAGRQSAITISTNMAGRGVDILLEDPSSGGLCVIGTNRHRSLRIDNQLRGRAGRQGDPGESQFYISLEDDLIEHYHIRSILPPPWNQEPEFASEETYPIDDPAVAEAINHTQRIVEGQLYQQRVALGRYSMLVEDQRQMIHSLHEKILTGEKVLTIWQDLASEKTAQLLRRTSMDEVQRAEQQAGALLLSQGWVDYLEMIEDQLGHINMMKSGPNDPLITFNRQVIDAYAHFLDTFEDDMVGLLDRLAIENGKISLAESGLASPPSTRTYLIEDGSDTLDNTLGISSMVAALASPVGFLMTLIARKWLNRPDKDR